MQRLPRRARNGKDGPDLEKMRAAAEQRSVRDVVMQALREAAPEAAPGPPGAPPLPIDAMLAYCGQGMVVACPDWKSLCLGIEKNEDGTYTVEYKTSVSGAYSISVTLHGVQLGEALSCSVAP